MTSNAAPSAPTPTDLQTALALLEPLVNPEPDDRAAYLDSDDALLASAMAYAAAGWPVFPCAPGAKHPITQSGLNDASTLVDQVQWWWRNVPTANIGVRCGVKFDVIDIDVAKDGFTSWADFLEDTARNGVKLPDILATAATGNGGRHIYVRPVPGARNGVNLGGKPGLDYRAAGGYVLVAPSRLVGAQRYRWVMAPDQRLLA